MINIRKRTRNSFFASLTIHLILLIGIGGVIPQFYISMPKPKPLPHQATEVELYSTKTLRHTLGKTNVMKRVSSLSKRQSLALRQRSNIDSLNKSRAAKRSLISTNAKLDENEDLLSASKYSNDQFESVKEPRTRVKTDVGNIEVGRGYASPESNTGKGSRDAQLGSALRNIAGQIVNTTSDRKIDVVFLIDTSGSMLDNIRSVARNLSEMISIFQESNLDYALGVTKFKYSKMLFFPLTADYTKYERLLMNVKCGGDERAYNAIVESTKRVKFRSDSTRRFILVTDEKLKGSYSIIRTIRRLKKANITLDIIGLDTPLQRNLAEQTGGIWYPIPQRADEMTED